MKTILLLLALPFYASTAFGQHSTSAPKDSSKPFILGRIESIQSTTLSEKRILNIYLPEGYKQDDTTQYPVIYLLDGSADEDFIHVVGLLQFDSFDWVNRVPKSIVVGIANIDRMRDFTYPTGIEADKKRYPHSGGSAKFIAFIEKELQPYIESKYKTNSTKTLIGESLGGLLATEIVLTKPLLFNKYIIISPSLWWDDASLLKKQSDIFLDSFKTKTDIYIGTGKEGLGPGEKPHVMEVDANLLSEEIKNTKSKSVHVFLDYLPQENHATISHMAIYNAFLKLYTTTAN